MAMEARLTQRMSQRVVMTPLLQQAIQLLQLSTLELQEVVQKELLENPLLEEVPVDGEGPAPPGEPEAAAPAPADVERGLQLVQLFDPPGIAARTAQECLLLQLRRDPNPDPVSIEIVEQHFEDLSRRRYQEIARALKLPLDRVMESIEEIMSLEPKPGRPFGG